MPKGQKKNPKAPDERLTQRSISLLPKMWEEIENIVQAGEFRNANLFIRALVEKELKARSSEK